MGVVLEVRDPSLRRTPAMKWRIAAGGEGLIERFRHERRRPHLHAQTLIIRRQ